MEGIGERFKEARNRKGISLSEASELTKIRSDFLRYIEQNEMDFGLPKVYRRGLVKNYARDLDLDVEKTVADYDAFELTQSRLGKRVETEWFGRMESKKSETDDLNYPAGSEASGPYGHIENKSADSTDIRHSRREVDRIFYRKIGLIVLAVSVLAFVIFGLIRSILGSGSDTITGNDLGLDDPAESSAFRETNSPTIIDTGEITLLATGEVFVLVQQKSDKKELYRNAMKEGQQVTFRKTGPVSIFFTAGEHLMIEQGGERFRPNASGSAKIVLQ